MFHAVWRGHGAFQNGNGFCRIGSFGGLSGLDVPELPWGAVHDRLGEEGCYIQIVLVGAVNLAHGGGVVIIPDWRDIARFIQWIAFCKGAYQGLFNRACLVEEFQCLFCGGAGKIEGAFQVGRIEGHPLLVVVGARRIGDAPLGHGAVGIMFGGLLEAAHGLFMIVAITPDQAAIEPELGFL